MFTKFDLSLFFSFSCINRYTSLLAIVVALLDILLPKSLREQQPNILPSFTHPPIHPSTVFYWSFIYLYAIPNPSPPSDQPFPGTSRGAPGKSIGDGIALLESPQENG